jgi:hypothetical protein
MKNKTLICDGEYGLRLINSIQWEEGQTKIWYIANIHCCKVWR